MCYAFLCTIAFAAISGVLFSCAKEELDYGKLNLIGEPKTVTANATLPKSANVDKTLVDSDGNVKWESSDVITVNGSILRITSIASSGTEAVFSGTAGAVIGTNGYWATYPFAPQRSDYTNNSVSVTLPAKQTYSPGDRLQNYMVAYAVSADPEINFAFKNLCSIIKIPVQAASGKTGDAAKLSRIEIQSTRTVSGTATVTMDGAGNPSLEISDGKSKVTLNCGNVDVSSKQTFSIILPAGTQSLTVKFYDATGKYMKLTLSGTGSGVGISRNHIYTTATVSFDATESTGELPGEFSVDENRKICFSQGSLQWSPTGGGSTATSHTVADNSEVGSRGTWRFAEHQYDVITLGNDNVEKVKYDASGNYTGTYYGWLDLFGWGTSGYHAANDQYNTQYTPYSKSSHFQFSGNTPTNNFGFGPSTNMPDPNLTGTSANYDWGVYNAISNGGDAPGQWRTLSQAEWRYIFDERTGASSLFGRGRIKTGSGNNPTNDYCEGVILLPDGWTCPASLTFNSGFSGSSGYSRNEYTLEQWALMESSGAVFLPAGGRRVESATSYCYSPKEGYYQSSTYSSSENSRYVNFATNVINYSNENRHYRFDGMIVRLVKDID